MRTVLLIAFLFIGQLAIGQEQDSITVPVSKVIETAEKIRELERIDVLKTTKIVTLEAQVVSLETLNSNNESIIKLKDVEILMYKQFTERFIDIGLPEPDKPKWYNSKTAHFVYGALTSTAAIYLGAKLSGQF